MAKQIALVTGEFHRKEALIMVEAAKSAAAKNDLTVAEEVWVPGSMEAPLAVKRLFAAGVVEGIAVLGIIERGETKHGLVMAQAVTKSLIELQLEFMKPVGMGILGPEINPSQIQPRLVPYAHAAVEAIGKMLK